MLREMRTLGVVVLLGGCHDFGCGKRFVRVRERHEWSEEEKRL